MKKEERLEGILKLVEYTNKKLESIPTSGEVDDVLTKYQVFRDKLNIQASGFEAITLFLKMHPKNVLEE